MPVLSNPKHEIFAQEIAKGKTADQAYVTAGYKKNPPHASRLVRNGNIQARMAELLNEAAVLVGVTVEGQTEHLRRIAEKSEKLGEVGGLSVARAAHMDIAKLNGLIVEKKEIRTGLLDDVEPATLAAAREQLIAARTGRADRGVQSGHSGKPH